MNPIPNDISTEEFRHLLQNDPQFKAALDAYVEAQLRRQYVAGLQELIRMMKDPERKEKEVLAISSGVDYPGRPMIEDIPLLIELVRLAYQTSTYAYSLIEKMAFKQLSDLLERDELLKNEKMLEMMLDLFTETFRHTRKRDRFASQRRFFSMKLVANLASRTQDEQKLALLHEALNHSTLKIRIESILHLYQAYTWLGCDVPVSLLDRLKQITETDRSKKARYTAESVLYELASKSEMS